MNLMGLDISSVAIGVSIINDKEEQIKIEVIEIKKIDDVFDKVTFAFKIIKDMIKEYNVDVVYVEKAMEYFQNQLSTAKTILTLDRVNTLIRYELWKNKINIKTINVLTARKLAGIKYPENIDNKNKKMFIYEEMKKRGFVFQEEYKKSGKNKGKVRETVCDQSDAVVISLAGIQMEKNNKNA